MTLTADFCDVMKAMVEGRSIRVACTDDDCDHRGTGVPDNLRCVDDCDEMSIEVGDYVFWSGSTRLQATF